MPLPKPRDGETESEFIERCMGNEAVQQEFEDNDQRLAVCYTQWEKSDLARTFAEAEIEDLTEKSWRGKPMERKTVKFEVKDINEEEGVFEGYAATFSKEPDSYGDVIEKGAFRQTLKNSKDRIKILWNHNVMEPIGKPLELSEDDVGLHIKGKLSLGVQRAREVLSLMKDGVITELSIGYDTITEAWDKGIRHLKEIRLWDTSPVVFAANSGATITGVKSDLEKLLMSGHVLSVENRGKVETVINALQALLDVADDTASSKSTQEPDNTTPEPEKVNEAADVEGILSNIEAELEGFDTQQAESRLDELLDKINMEVQVNARSKGTYRQNSKHLGADEGQE